MKEMETYRRLTDNLGKLKRNLSQMSEGQKKRFARQLDDLKRQVAADASEIAKAYLISGMLFSGAQDVDDLKRGIGKVLDEDRGQTARAASKVLFSVYDVRKFLSALSSLKMRVWYEAYGPYWLGHCAPTGDPDFPYGNALIGMVWDAKDQVWVSRDGMSFRTALPPTEELLREYYARDAMPYAIPA